MFLQGYMSISPILHSHRGDRRGAKLRKYMTLYTEKNCPFTAETIVQIAITLQMLNLAGQVAPSQPVEESCLTHLFSNSFPQKTLMYLDTQKIDSCILSQKFFVLGFRLLLIHHLRMNSQTQQTLLCNSPLSPVSVMKQLTQIIAIKEKLQYLTFVKNITLRPVCPSFFCLFLN